MKKKMKDMILIVIMLLSILGIVFSVHNAKVNVSDRNYKDMNQVPPDMQDPPFDMDGKGQEELNHFGKGGMEDSNHSNPSEFKNEINLDTKTIIMIGVCSFFFASAFFYFVMSFKNEFFYVFKDKLLIYILSSILLFGVLTLGIIYFTRQSLPERRVPFKQEDATDKDEVSLDQNNVIQPGEIDLSKYNQDVTIKEAGTYRFSGNFTHSILVDAKNEEVEIILNGVTIQNENTATIIGIAANKIKIKLEEGTENILSDGGNSSYDGCIFSNAELEFYGKGSLTVNGKQNEGEGIATEAKNITFNGGTYVIVSRDDGINAGGDGATITINDGTIYIDASGDGIDSNQNAIINGGQLFVMGSDVGGDAGIDTDQGYVINGGLVVALGSDMIEVPKSSSSQKTIAFTLDAKIEKDTLVTLMKENEVIVSFQASKSYKTIIISSDILESGTYSLYKGGENTGTLKNGIYQNGNYTKGEKITVRNQDNFQVSSNVNLFGGR